MCRQFESASNRSMRSLMSEHSPVVIVDTSVLYMSPSHLSLKR